MDELIAQITEKTGVTSDKAKEMLNVTTEWMKDKLPEDLTKQVTSVLSGAAGMATEAAGTAIGTASGVASSATGKAEKLWSKAKDTVTGSSSDDE